MIPGQFVCTAMATDDFLSHTDRKVFPASADCAAIAFTGGNTSEISEYLILAVSVLFFSIRLFPLN